MSVDTGEVHNALENLEDYSLDNHLSRSYNYNVLLNALERKVPLSLKGAERLLSVCVHDLKEDKQHAATIVDIIYMIVTQVNEKLLDPQPDLTPSLLAVIEMTKILPPGSMENIRSLCFRTLLSYPNDILLVASMADILQIVDHNINIADINKIQPLYFLNKILNILPTEQKKVFVENGLDIWLSKVVPITMIHYQKASPDVEQVLETLEILTEYIVTLDYTMNRHWRSILISICSSSGYSYLMKKRLSEGCGLWHRVWIVFIKLLKHQITQSLLDIGTPINSMLPVVEAAFKLDIPNRCRAFQCWNVLIDSFSTETNERNIHKRLKLVIIPLKSNNAKAEDTVLAKLDCWLHLFRKFENKMEKFLDSVLVSFLNFCFGKPQCTDKSVLVPGQISIKTQKMCMEVIVEMFGHICNCSGCTQLPKLSAVLINAKHLVDNWNYWILALTTTIVLTAESDYGLNNSQLMCLWKSFLLTIGELKDSNIKKNLLNEVISVVDVMLKGCGSNNKVADLVINVLLFPLFEGDIRIMQLLKSKTGENDPLYNILKIVINPTLDVMYQRCNTKELIKKFKCLTNFITNMLYSSPNSVIDWILTNLPERNSGLILLTSLSESISETQCTLGPTVVRKMLMWPLKAINSFISVTVVDYVKISARTWHKLYGILMQNIPEVNKADIDIDVSKFLFTSDEVNSSKSQLTVYYKLCVVSAVLKYKVTNTSCNDCGKELDLFKNLTNNIDSYSSYGLLFPTLIEDAKAIMTSIKPGVTDVTIVRKILISVKNMIRVLDSECGKCSQELLVWKLNENLCKSLKTIFLNSLYEELISEIFVDFVEHSSSLMQYTPIRDIILKVQLKNRDINEVPSKGTKTLLEENISVTVTTVNLKDSENISKFPAPDTKNVPKKSKKKQAKIVNTVVENGEEYVVVKSNWKFNPRKLTENQKEKLQRKREDIPALYQDLSQSQDEFKLVTWRTDSQDTSTSSKSESVSSKTNNNESASDIIKKIPKPTCSVVPKIMENFLSENEGIETTNNLRNLETPSPKNTKSPRMALKDRVFKNVRNLIEKSGVQKENKDVSEDINKTFNTPNTLTQTEPNNIDNIVNSASPMLSEERPSRVKRKPRKFDDTDLISIKRTRRASYDIQSGRKIDNQDTGKSSQYEDHNAIHEGNSFSVVVEIHGENKSNEKQNTVCCADAVSDKESIENKTLGKEKSPSVVVESVEINNRIGLVDEVVKTNTKGNEINTMEREIRRISDGEEFQASNIDLASACTNNDGNGKSASKKRSDNVTSESYGDKSNKKVLIPENESKQMNDKSNSTPKKTRVRKSRIEKELAIDMVEGHPFLNTQSQKRLTRKALETNTNTRRKTLVDKLNKSKSEVLDSGSKMDKKLKEKNKSKSTSITVNESQDKYSGTKENTSFSEEFPLSDDVIESSQDSTATTISVKSTKKIPKVAFVSIEKIPIQNLVASQSILDCVANAPKPPSTKEDKDDTMLPLNKTVADEVSPEDLTENVDTEPIDSIKFSDAYTVLDEASDTITVSDDTEVGPETQELAEADTIPIDSKDFMNVDAIVETSNNSVIDVPSMTVKIESSLASYSQSCGEKSTSPTDATVTLSESACVKIEKSNGVSSPLNTPDEAERKQDFLNSTLEISPIKTMSPDKSNSPSPETSSDFVVIKLSSPVHSNGEPYDKCESPEVFTEDKTSPDKRHQSPPRAEVTVTNASPSSSLSLKKNRPQMRSGGRGAQMLGLCVPDQVQDTVNIDRYEPEEAKRSNTPARRNLRVIYNSVTDNTETATESEDSGNFLKFRKSVPAVNSSPSNPILKRKLVEITDDVMISPASKRKRVSFHDPPVSTTVSVQKYIEPVGVRSPQNSANKRHERQMLQQTPFRSPKRLSNVFKLDTALTKTVESFSDAHTSSTPDYTQSISLDETPVVEIVRTSELNDTDPICPELVNCKDGIINITSELLSPSLKIVLVQALKKMANIETVGDLAKMTELEVNRLCIKTPKVKVARKALANYASKIVKEVGIDEATLDAKIVDMEVQTDKQEYCEKAVQTIPTLTVLNSSQTEVPASRHMTVQTDQTGSTSTADVIKTCLIERPDFIKELKEHLEESSILEIADKISFVARTDLLLKQINSCNSKHVVSKIIRHQCTSKVQSENIEMQYFRKFICDKYEAKDLILFCSDVLKYVYNKPA